MHPVGSTSTTPPWSKPLAPNEHLSFTRSGEAPAPEVLLLREIQGGGKGNPHAPGEPLSLDQS